MKKVLVTGGCGLIGDHICSGFLKKGYEVVAVDSKASDYNAGKENYTFYQAKPSEKSKYAEIDQDGLDIHFTQMDTEENDGKTLPALYANIPIKNMNHGVK